MGTHAQIMDLLRREADMGYAYGQGMECPSCEGSGLIGGFAGQRQAFRTLDEAPLTAAERKRLKQALSARFPSVKQPKSAEEKRAARLAAAQAFIARQGAPKPKVKRGALADPRFSNIAAIRALLEEQKAP